MGMGSARALSDTFDLISVIDDCGTAPGRVVPCHMDRLHCRCMVLAWLHVMKGILGGMHRAALTLLDAWQIWYVMTECGDEKVSNVNDSH